MSTFLTVFARTLHTVALSLWLGGLVAVGALVAPTAFHVTRTQPVFFGNLGLQNAIAGGVVGGSLHLFTFVCYGSGFLLLVSNGLLLPLASRRWAVACLATTALLLLSSLYLGLSLTPAMDAAQAKGQMSAFDAMHHHYEQVSSLLQMPLLLLLALFAALRDTRRA